MNSIQILQLGRLHLTDRNWKTSAEQVERELISAKLHGKIYCIVVCGGLTGQQTAQTFDAAGKFLERVRDFLRDPGVDWKKRLVLVPGPSDYKSMSRQSTQAFKGFYDDFFQGIDNDFSDNRSSVRWLRDITLLAASYTNGSDEAESISSFDNLRNQIEQKISASHGLEYIRHGPVVLVTAETPLLDLYLRKRGWDRSVRNTFHAIDLHLFGSGQVAFLPSEPFCFAPVTVGLGPRPNGQQEGVIQMNAIEFQRPTVPRPPAEQPSHLRFDLKVNSFFIAPPAPERWAMNYHSSRPQSVALAEERLLSQGFLDKLSDQLQKNFFVSVLGYGDVWRQVVAKGLKNRKEIGGNSVEIKTITSLTSYPSGRPGSWRLEQFTAYRELDNFRGRKQLNSGAAIRIAVLTDEAFSVTDQNRRDVYEAVRRELSKLCTRDFRIIYLVSAWELPTAGTPPPNTSTMRLEPLDSESFEKLIELFSLTVPIDQALIASLSSGYVSFLSLLFEEALEHFSDWKIERTPGREACLELVEHALEYSERLRDEKDRFFDFMREQPSGISIANFIFGLLRTAPSLREQIKLPVKFLYSELRAAGINPADVSALEETGIVKDVGGRFELQERVPFLTEIAQPAKPAKIFISYAEPDKPMADELAHALRHAGLEVWEFTRASRFQQKLRDEIMDRLRESAAVVVIWTHESVKSRYVIREAREAAKPNKPKLINWFVDVSPPSVRHDFGRDPSHTEVNRDSEVLREFKDFQGKYGMGDVVGLLMRELNPFAVSAKELNVTART